LFPHVAGMIGMHHCAQPLVEMCVWGISFFPGWPQIMILPISVTQVTRIIGVSHQHPALYSKFYSQDALSSLFSA
jgi:hypothetical protein